MLGVWDLVNCISEIHDGLKGRIKAVDDHRHIVISVELEHYLLVVLLWTTKSRRSNGTSQALSGPKRIVAYLSYWYTQMKRGLQKKNADNPLCGKLRSMHGTSYRPR